VSGNNSIKIWISKVAQITVASDAKVFKYLSRLLCFFKKAQWYNVDSQNFHSFCAIMFSAFLSANAKKKIKNSYHTTWWNLPTTPEIYTSTQGSNPVLLPLQSNKKTILATQHTLQSYIFYGLYMIWSTLHRFI
jgi:hypothetical protein